MNNSPAERRERIARALFDLGGERENMVQRIATALCHGDSGGYDTLLEMYAHTALKTIEENFNADAILSSDLPAPTILVKSEK